MKTGLLSSLVGKVRLSILGTAVVAVVVSGAFVMVTEYSMYREGFVDNISSLSDVIAYNLSAPIVFENRREAAQTLESFATVPSVDVGVATDSSGRVFASYARGRGAGSPESLDLARWPVRQGGSVSTIDGRELRYSKAVVLDGELIGTLYVQASLEEIYGRMQFQLVALAVILCVAILVAFVAGSAMQRFITVPIQQLAKAMRNVSETRAYEVRVDKRNDDEIGVLVDGFNEMLREINARDRMLAAANDELEKQVQERTHELERANEELSRTLSAVEQAKEAAEAANRAKGAFLATMSHEIRTPINGMLGNTELLLNEPLTDEARRFGEIAYQSGEALLDIINDILDFSRIEAGKLEFSDANFDLGHVVNQLCLSLSAQIRRKGLAFDVDLSGAPDYLVVGDQGRVRQVLSNLITNATKFTEQGGIRVSLRTSPDGDGYVIPRFDVEDTGIGIRPSDQQIIFGRFAQADDSASRAFGGTGLGLAICRELVTRMGGEIGVESEYGEGARFWFTLRLPQTRQPAGESVQPAREPIGLNSPAELNCRVLVVDDNAINRDMARQMLEKFGCVTETAGDGEEAVRQVTEHGYDLVLMDCQMPVMDGFRATRRIRGLETASGRRPAYIVALTANAIKGDRDRCLQAGMDDYLAKPFKLADIRRTVEKAAARSAASPAPAANGVHTLATVLDAEAMANIRSIDHGNDDALLKRYVEIFLDSAPGLLDRMSRSYCSEDSEELSFAAHSLKSDSLAVGAIQLGNIARSLETLGRQRELAGAAELLEAARAEFERLQGALGLALKAG